MAVVVSCGAVLASGGAVVASDGAVLALVGAVVASVWAVVCSAAAVVASGGAVASSVGLEWTLFSGAAVVGEDLLQPSTMSASNCHRTRHLKRLLCCNVS